MEQRVGFYKDTPSVRILNVPGGNTTEAKERRNSRRIALPPGGQFAASTYHVTVRLIMLQLVTIS